MSSDANSRQKDPPLENEDEGPTSEPAQKAPEPDTMDREVTQLLMKHYTDQFWSGLTKTNLALLAWLGALILIFIDPILFLPDDARKQKNMVADIVRQQSDFNRKEGQEIQARADRVPEPTTVPPESGTSEPTPKNENTPTKTPQRTQSAESNQNSFEDKKQEALETLSKLRTPFGEIAIRAVFAPLIWSVLFIGLLMFFLHKRVVLVATLSKAIDLHMKYRPGKISNVSGLGSWSPFWLAPLPKASAESPFSDEVVKQYLGWTTGAGWRAKLTLACLLGAHLLYGVVAWNTVQLIRFYRDPQLAFALGFVVIGIFVSSIFITIAWLSSQVKLGTFPEQFIEPSNTRRKFLRTGISIMGLGVASGLATLAMPLGPLRRLGVVSRIPRFRRPSPVEPLWDLKNKFVLNGRSKVVHYIGGNGMIADRIFVSATRIKLPIAPHSTELTLPMLHKSALAYQAKSTEYLKEPHFNVTHAGALSECLGIERMNSADALEIIWSGILLDAALKQKSSGTPSYRLYDLYAGLAVRYSKTGELSKMIDYAESTWQKGSPGKYPGIEKRLQRWRKPSPGWQKKWRESEICWKPSKGDLKRPELYSGYCK